MTKPKKQRSDSSPAAGKTVRKTKAVAKNPAKSSARVSCVQWMMRHYASVEDFLHQVESYVRSQAVYQSDVVLFPEFFNVALTGLTPQLNPMAAMRALALHTPMLVEKISAMAVKHHINVVAGSLPLLEKQTLYNVAYLCHRDGRIDAQYKLHPTPGEKRDWDIRGGNSLRVFDTDFGRVGMLICYDVEFPELPRLLSEQHMQILLVPFWTDSKNGYLRVRHCAQARAIENECYVALAGSTGALPELENVDVQYAQSAIFSPSDFCFPHDAIINEATANVETTLIADLDLDKLQSVKDTGAVRNFHDRRRDLYQVKWTGKKSAG
jgi:predicted amidohydrolase